MGSSFQEKIREERNDEAVVYDLKQACAMLTKTLEECRKREISVDIKISEPAGMIPLNINSTIEVVAATKTTTKTF